MASTLKCIKCESEVETDDAFCIFCGTKVSETIAKRKLEEAEAPAVEEPVKEVEPEPREPVEEELVKEQPKEEVEEAPSATTGAGEESTPEEQESVAPSDAPAAPAEEEATESPAPAVEEAPEAQGAQEEEEPAKAEEKPLAKAESDSVMVANTAQHDPTDASESSMASMQRPEPRKAVSEVQRKPRSDAEESVPRRNLPSRGSMPDSMHDYGRSSFELLSSEVAGLDKLWVPDNFSSECMDCKTKFGFPRPRRHHCRVCGLLFCKRCVQNKVHVPGSFGYGNSPQRCCKNCVIKLNVKAISSPADVFAQRKASSATQPAHQSDNHYTVLDVSENASQDEIERQYQAKSKDVDPSNRDEVERLDRAYYALQDPQSRQIHDIEINNDGSFSSSSSGPIYPTDTARSDQTECQVCFRPFKLGRRQHHCRRCTRSVCNACSPGIKPIKELGFPNGVRHCTSCMDNPPPFQYLTIEPDIAPPAGFEYLSKLDIQLSVKYNPMTDDDAFDVVSFCEPNKESLRNMNHSLTDAEREVAHNFSVTNRRTFTDFEWLFHALGEHANPKALPFFPERKQGAQVEKSLQTFLTGCLIHPKIRDAVSLKAFCVLPKKKLDRFKSEVSNSDLINSERLDDLKMTFRLALEKGQVQNKLNILLDRKKSHEDRLEEQKHRKELQARREEVQKIRREQAEKRFNILENRKKGQLERIEREKARLSEQLNSVHIVFHDTVEDEAKRHTEEEVRLKEKVEFTKSKDVFQKDTTEWNNDMANWSKHRTDWSEHHNPQVSKEIASEWLVRGYGLYHGPTSKPIETAPAELVQIYDRINKILEKEPELLESEGQYLDEEWSKLSKERDNWTAERANMKREDKMWAEEDLRFKEEADLVEREKESRKKKMAIIEKELSLLKTDIAARFRAIQSRKTRHVSLDQEFENEWRVTQDNRINHTTDRINGHNERINRAKKRCETFSEQLQRQTTSKRMLLFKRARLNDERKGDLKVYTNDKEECRNTFEECKSSRAITPEYVSRIKSDLGIRQNEYQIVLESNKRIPAEGDDSNVNENDPFMNDVRKRRAEFQRELDEQKRALEEEEEFSTSILNRLEEHITKLDNEINNASHEEELINEFNTTIENEVKILGEEESKREEKKSFLTNQLNDAGNWVLSSLHCHSKRKKKEADRLVKQASRASQLQELVQHFTHRVIEQEERIMREKQRILNGEHKVEMLKSSESWYQYVTLNGPDYIKKDEKCLETGRKERVDDLKAATKLQKNDDDDIKGVVQELEESRRFSKEKEEKRSVWSPIEEVYSTEKAQEKDEDMMMTSQIRGLLKQLAEAFEMLTNRLLEEEESLQQASSQLKGEVDSINSFMERMESEESALCSTEKGLLTKEAQLKRTEGDLIEQRARALVDSYKKMQTEHGRYPNELESVRNTRAQRGIPSYNRDAELEYLKKILKERNYYDKNACIQFAKKFHVDNHEFRELRDCYEYMKVILDKEIKSLDKWVDWSREDRKKVEDIKAKASDIDWEKDTLTKIPAFQEMQQKLSRNGDGERSSGGFSVHPNEQWIVDLISLKRNISEKDSSVISSSSEFVSSSRREENDVSQNCGKLKQDRESVLNTLRYIDQEEANAVRNSSRNSKRGTSNSVSNRESETDSDSHRGLRAKSGASMSNTQLSAAVPPNQPADVAAA